MSSTAMWIGVYRGSAAASGRVWHVPSDLTLRERRCGMPQRGHALRSPAAQHRSPISSDPMRRMHPSIRTEILVLKVRASQPCVHWTVQGRTHLAQALLRSASRLANIAAHAPSALTRSTACTAWRRQQSARLSIWFGRLRPQNRHSPTQLTHKQDHICSPEGIRQARAAPACALRRGIQSVVALPFLP